jgi:hypothetical protein
MAPKPLNIARRTNLSTLETIDIESGTSSDDSTTQTPTPELYGRPQSKKRKKMKHLVWQYHRIPIPGVEPLRTTKGQGSRRI